MWLFWFDVVSSATNTTNLVIKGCDRDSHVAKTGCVDSHSDHYFQDGQGVNINKYIKSLGEIFFLKKIKIIFVYYF